MRNIAHDIKLKKYLSALRWKVAEMGWDVFWTQVIHQGKKYLQFPGSQREEPRHAFVLSSWANNAWDQ